MSHSPIPLFCQPGALPFFQKSHSRSAPLSPSTTSLPHTFSPSPPNLPTPISDRAGLGKKTHRPSGNRSPDLCPAEFFLFIIIPLVHLVPYPCLSPLFGIQEPGLVHFIRDPKIGQGGEEEGNGAFDLILLAFAFCVLRLLSSDIRGVVAS